MFQTQASHIGITRFAKKNLGVGDSVFVEYKFEGNMLPGEVVEILEGKGLGGDNLLKVRLPNGETVEMNSENATRLTRHAMQIAMQKEAAPSDLPAGGPKDLFKADPEEKYFPRIPNAVPKKKEVKPEPKKEEPKQKTKTTDTTETKKTKTTKTPTPPKEKKLSPKEVQKQKDEQEFNEFLKKYPTFEERQKQQEQNPKPLPTDKAPKTEGPGTAQPMQGYPGTYTGTKDPGQGQILRGPHGGWYRVGPDGKKVYLPKKGEDMSMDSLYKKALLSLPLNLRYEIIDMADNAGMNAKEIVDEILRGDQGFEDLPYNDLLETVIDILEDEGLTASRKEVTAAPQQEPVSKMSDEEVAELWDKLDPADQAGLLGNIDSHKTTEFDYDKEKHSWKNLTPEEKQLALSFRDSGDLDTYKKDLEQKKAPETPSTDKSDQGWEQGPRGGYRRKGPNGKWIYKTNSDQEKEEMGDMYHQALELPAEHLKEDVKEFEGLQNKIEDMKQEDKDVLEKESKGESNYICPKCGKEYTQLAILEGDGTCPGCGEKVSDGGFPATEAVEEKEAVNVARDMMDNEFRAGDDVRTIPTRSFSALKGKITKVVSTDRVMVRWEDGEETEESVGVIVQASMKALGSMFEEGAYVTVMEFPKVPEFLVGKRGKIEREEPPSSWKVKFNVDGMENSFVLPEGALESDNRR